MQQFPLLISFIFGAVAGSFLNVVAMRFRTGMGLEGRSKCLSCGKTLLWHELVPLLSFVLLKGRCGKCKGKISWQYPLVEILSGLVFVLIIMTFPPQNILAAIITFIQLFAAGIVVVMTIHDIKYKVIPDQLVFSFDALALISLFVGGTSYIHGASLWQILAGPILALPFALIWLFSGGKWMGLGDAKLILGIGWFLGLNGGLNALFLSFWIGAAVSIVWLFATYKRFRPGTEIPFGPYLILGMYLVMLLGVRVVDFNLL